MTPGSARVFGPADGLPRLARPLRSMQEIDSWPWLAGLAIEAYGVRFGVRVDDVDLLPQIQRLLPPSSVQLPTPVVRRLFSLRSARSGEPVLVFENGHRMCVAPSVDIATRYLEDAMERYVTFSAPGLVFVHAGVVEWRGRAIVIPGSMYSGKTTLVAELVRAGATYLSDEYAVLDTHGRVHPYARPLYIRPPDGSPPRRFPVEKLGGSAATATVPAGMIILTEYVRGEYWQPRELSHGEGAVALLSHLMRARRRPVSVLTAIQRLLAGTRVLRGPRGDAAETARAILTDSATWEPVCA